MPTVNYCSDVIEYAMRLAKLQAENSFNFKDLYYVVNQEWRYIYQRICEIDKGFYSEVLLLEDVCTHLPPMASRIVNVYRENPYTGRRDIFSHGNNLQYRCRGKYYIEGQDLYCHEVMFGQGNIYVQFIPRVKTIQFTANNHVPEIMKGYTPKPIPSPQRYHLYYMETAPDSTGRLHYIMKHGGDPTGHVFDITDVFERTDFGFHGRSSLYDIVRVILDYPYAFITYKHRGSVGDIYQSYILKNILGAVERVRYNPFDFSGRITNVEFLEVYHNEDTGMYCIINDWDDIDSAGNPVMKKLGWTPDTMLDFPHESAFDLLVANVAYRIAMKNESQIADIQYAKQQAQAELDKFLKKDQNMFYRINNSTYPRISDFI